MLVRFDSIYQDLLHLSLLGIFDDKPDIIFPTHQDMHMLRIMTKVLIERKMLLFVSLCIFFLIIINLLLFFIMWMGILK